MEFYAGVNWEIKAKSAYNNNDDVISSSSRQAQKILQK